MGEYTARADGRGIHHDLGGSADKVWIPSAISARSVEIVHRTTTSTTPMWVRGDSTVAVVEEDGTDVILPGSFTTIDAEPGGWVSIIGASGDSWSLRVIS